MARFNAILAIMSEEERTGRLMEDFRKAKERLSKLEFDADNEAKVLQKMVDWLKSPGERGSDSVGMPTDHYFSKRIVALIEELKEARRKRNEIQQTLADMGHRVS